MPWGFYPWGFGPASMRRRYYFGHRFILVLGVMLAFSIKQLLVPIENIFMGNILYSFRISIEEKNTLRKNGTDVATSILVD